MAYSQKQIQSLMFLQIVNKSPKLWMVNKNVTIFCFLVVLLKNLSVADGQTTFERRNSFSLGPNVTTAKFSPDYTLLAVLRSGSNKLFSYNPKTFELIGEAELEPGTSSPRDLEIFGTDILILTNPNILLVYERKINSANLTLKQKVILKTYGGVSGMKLQKLTEDFNDKSQANSTRHLVIWSIFSEYSFEVYKYTASQQANKITFLFDKVYEPSAKYFSDFEFFDDKYLVFGMRQSATVGETYLIELSNTSKITKVDSKVTGHMMSFNVKPTGALSSQNYLAVSRASEVSQFRTKGKSIQEGGNQISSIQWGKTFSDNNKMIGFYNDSSLYVYKCSELFYKNYPTYTAKLEENNKQDSLSIYIVAMPQSNTGQLISNHCYENGQQCFYYYSLCAPNTHYTTNALGNQVCKKCTSDQNCQKCFTDGCVMCNTGYYFNQNKKCQLCNLEITGCTSCSQDGKICHACDTKEFEKNPVDNVCQCIKGTVWQKNQKKCVQCSTKIPNCGECFLSENSYQCTKCAAEANRIPSQDGKSCICDSFYYENVSKLCQLCDPYQKCETCTSSNNCLQCDAAKHWILNGQGKCECMPDWIEVNNKCLECEILGCKTCETANTCKTCQEGFKLDEQKKCVCNEDRFLNVAKKQCELCSNYIAGCYKCSNSSQCAVCDIKLHREPSPNKDGKCGCEAQYTENSKKQCVLCTTPGCLNCQGENYCTICSKDKGFVANPSNGRCSCLSTKFLDNDSGTCKECSSVLTGCSSCDSNSTCNSCNETASFNSHPLNGTCKCIQNFFISENECLKCQMICEHCNKCAEILSISGLESGTKVGCSDCDDGFEVKDFRCVQKSSYVWLIILLSIGGVVILSIVICCCMRRRNLTRLDKERQETKRANASLVKMLLQENASEKITIDRTQPGTSRYGESMFSNGNINYSISSVENEVDKKSFNQTLKEMERERRREIEEKKKANGSNYAELGRSMKEAKKKPELTQEEVLGSQKAALFGHRGKG